NSRVVLFGFAEGQELTEHTSTQSAVVQILSGECEFSLGGKPHTAKTREPFSKIMNAVGQLQAEEKLLLVAPFEPAPLFSVLGKQGFEHQSKRLQSGD